MIDLHGVSGLNVSRETEDQLNTFFQLLEKWTQKINLVAPKSMENAWTRHFLDSAQVFAFRSCDAGTWVDFGSGAGFPGLVCAILAKEKYPDLDFTLVESDARKSIFLRTVVRELGLGTQVLNQRIENIGSLNADIVSARAVASLDKLLPLAKQHLSQDGKCLFLKGERWQKEVSEARKTWNFSMTNHKSKTDDNAVILEIGDISHV